MDVHKLCASRGITTVPLVLASTIDVVEVLFWTLRMVSACGCGVRHRWKDPQPSLWRTGNRAQGVGGANAVLDHVCSARSTFHPPQQRRWRAFVAFSRPDRRVALFVAFATSCGCTSLFIPLYCRVPPRLYNLAPREETGSDVLGSIPDSVGGTIPLLKAWHDRAHKRAAAIAKTAVRGTCGRQRKRGWGPTVRSNLHVVVIPSRTRSRKETWVAAHTSLHTGRAMEIEPRRGIGRKKTCCNERDVVKFRTNRMSGFLPTAISWPRSSACSTPTCTCSWFLVLLFSSCTIVSFLFVGCMLFDASDPFFFLFLFYSWMVSCSIGARVGLDVPCHSSVGFRIRTHLQGRRSDA